MKAKKPKFPIVVKRGSCAVKIYQDRKTTGTYFRVVYNIGGKRHRLNFCDLQTAINEAEAKAAQLSRGDVDAMQLSGRDRLIYGRAADALRDAAVSLDAAAIEYAEAQKILDGFPLLDAVRFYARHHGRGIKRKRVGEAVSEIIDSKKKSGVTEVYLADLRYRLGLFAKQFVCDVVALTPDDVRSFFEELRLSPRSFNNFQRALHTFFRFAQDREWLSKEVNLLSTVQSRKEKATPVHIFAPAELSAVLAHSSASLAPCLALAAFAGLRSEEVIRLDWSDVWRRPGFIEIAADKAKTSARRLVPITENLTRWIATAFQAEGAVWPRSKTAYFDAIRDTAARAGVRWKQNALRHSWTSYRLAEVQDVNRVALEAGNSPQMIFRHYRELATPEQAKSWFSIAPDVAENIVPITASHATA